MRDTNAANIAALQSGTIIPAWILVVRAKTLAGATANFGFWTGDGDVAVELDAWDGGTQTHTLKGDGRMLPVETVTLRADITVQRHEVLLSAADSTVLDMIHGHRTRLMKAEIHCGLIDPATGALAGRPMPMVFGTINSAPKEIPAGALNGNGSGEALIKLQVASLARALTRINPARRSDAMLRARNVADDYYKDADTVADWKVFWGEAEPDAARAGS
jgi:hypothetical protein